MMRSKFDEQLDRLNKEMMKMGSAIEDSIRKAVDALVKQDAELAKKVMIQDEEIDREQKTIESICFNLLIQQQPVVHTHTPRLEAMRFNLFGQKVLAGDLELFLLGIAGHLDDLQAVQQRGRNIFHIIRRGDEHHAA